MDDYALLGLGEEIELLGEDDELGAVRRRARRRVRSRGYSKVAHALRERAPGIPKPAAMVVPLGFTFAQFVNAGATTATITATPQKAFKGTRLVVDEQRTGAGTGGIVTITSIIIGQSNQPVAATPLPARAFGPTAFGVNMALDPASPGIIITIGLAISAAPGVGDTVDISTMLLGYSLS